MLDELIEGVAKMPIIRLSDEFDLGIEVISKGFFSVDEFIAMIEKELEKKESETK